MYAKEKSAVLMHEQFKKLNLFHTHTHTYTDGPAMHGANLK